MVVQKLLEEAQYFDLAKRSPEKVELRDGVPFAMVGGSMDHASIAGSLIMHLGPKLAPERCRVLTSDYRVAINHRNFFYPDVSVFCRPVEAYEGRDDTGENPVLVAEVLSPSTEFTDRGQKVPAYRTIPSLQVILLIAQDRPEVEVYERQDDHSWSIRTLTEGKIGLRTLDITLEVAALYAQVNFDEPA